MTLLPLDCITVIMSKCDPITRGHDHMMDYLDHYNLTPADLRKILSCVEY